ncbi:MAG TPA: phosphosulfolactate synthase [Crocinitomix sp.]|nr:phosphosulfolactate synthase [Crocinitomix sp.]
MKYNFDLPFIPKRTIQPRDSGVTMMMDKGLSVREVEDFLEANANYTDIVKFGFGTSLVIQNLEEKLKLYRSVGIKPYFGGTLFEVFIARNQFDDYRRFIDKYKLELCEVSDGSIEIPHEEKLKYISELAKDRTVLSEVGSKDAGIIISPSKWIRMMKTELEAGSWKVIAEGRESGTVGVFRPNGTAHTYLINKIIKTIKPEDILWEAPKKTQQVWFIRLFGHNVNLGNIAPNEVIPLECLRLGLRGDTFFQFLPKDIEERLRQKNVDDTVEDEN